MNTRADKTKENKCQSVANAVSQKQSKDSTFQFVDNRPEAVAQRKVQAMVNYHSTQQQSSIQKKENNTGLPDNLKSGIENLSGYSMDDAKVHYNSDKPTQLNAHAYAQGSDIHLGSGQEKHLPHEAWHVVQQKQGRVNPTMQMKDKVNINDDKGLEREADVMGGKALQMIPLEKKTPLDFLRTNTLKNIKHSPIQRVGEAKAMSAITSKKKGEDNFTSNEMVRGNATPEIKQSNGVSMAWVQKLRSKDFEEKLKIYIHRHIPNPTGNMNEFDDWYNKNLNFIRGLTYKTLGYGNCGEFAKALMSQLMMDTANQNIYKASLLFPVEPKSSVEKDFVQSNPDVDIVNGDHAWVVTSKKDLNHSTYKFIKSSIDLYLKRRLSQ